MSKTEEMRDGTAVYELVNSDRPCNTYYKIFGDLKSAQAPVIVIHGGPGSGHQYLLPYSALWQKCKIPVIFYDQIGCADSTRYQDRANDRTFWTVDLFADELGNLIDHLQLSNGSGYHLLGHSWGGMLGSYFASRRPQGLRSLTLASAPASIDLHAVCVRLNWLKLPQETQNALNEGWNSRNFESESFKAASTVSLRTFWCRADPFPPKDLAETQEDDHTVRTALYGEHYLEPKGILHGWNCFAELRNINVPTLVYHGEHDNEREEAIAPYLANIPGALRHTIPGASHMAHLDSTELLEAVLALAGRFLLEGKI